MSKFSSWSYTAKCTIWKATGFDAYDQPTGYERTVFDCDFKAGGDLVQDSAGVQFTAQSNVYLEAADADAPEVGSFLVIGVNTATDPPASAEQIRRVMSYNANTFDEGLPDRRLITG
jgi:hypothetical protein